VVVEFSCAFDLGTAGGTSVGAFVAVASFGWDDCLINYNMSL